MTGNDRFHDVSDDELDEMLAAFAVDALDPDERAQIEALLAEEGTDAAVLRSDADRYAIAADWLAEAVEPVAPSSGLWDQIAAQLDAPAPSSSLPDAPTAPTSAPYGVPVVVADLPAPGDDVAPVRPRPGGQADELAERRARREGWTPVTTLVAVAAAVVIVLVMGAALIVGKGNTDDAQDLAAAAQAAATQPGARVADLEPVDGATEGMHAQVVVAPDGQTYFVGDGLPALEADQAYQLWSVIDGGATAVSVGVLGSNPEVTMLSMGSEPGLLAVTVEPAAGSVSATTNPIVAGELA